MSKVYTIDPVELTMKISYNKIKRTIIGLLKNVYIKTNLKLLQFNHMVVRLQHFNIESTIFKQ